jgi:DNA-binding NarL/FixJ family response regulator
MKKIRLLLIEDNRLLRDGITTLIEEHDDIHATATLGTNEHILRKIRTFRPHVLLMDLGLRSQNSLQLVKAVTAQPGTTKVIVMDLIPTEADVLEFVRAGVSGFILKDATMEDFLKTIRSVARGVKVLPSAMTGSLFSQIIEHAVNGPKKSAARLMESVRMTRRERQVMNLVSEGMTNKEIAQRLNLSVYTVKSHVHNILEKLALHTRVQIAGAVHTSKSVQDVAENLSLLQE